MQLLGFFLYQTDAFSAAATLKYCSFVQSLFRTLPKDEMLRRSSLNWARSRTLVFPVFRKNVSTLLVVFNALPPQSRHCVSDEFYFCPHLIEGFV